MDVSKPFIDTLWIGTSKEYGWSVSVEYEGNHAYCQYCGLLGHTIGLCKKKRTIQGKALQKEGNDGGNRTIAAKSIKMHEKE